MTKPFRGTILNRTHPFARGLVGAWLFNEGSGNKVFDLSGGNNTGTLTNMTPSTDWIGGKDGFGLDFDGSNDHITIPHKDILEPDIITVVTSFISDRAIQYEEIVRKGNNSGTESYDFIRGFPSSGDLRWSIYSGGSWRDGPFIAINLGQRYTVVGTYDGSTIRMYLDGYEVGTPVSYSGAVGKGGDVLNFGNRSSGDRHFLGKIFYTYIYNRVFTAAEVFQFSKDPYAMFRREFSPAIFGDLGVPPSFIPYPRLSGLGGGIGNSISGGMA